MTVRTRIFVGSILLVMLVMAGGLGWALLSAVENSNMERARLVEISDDALARLATEQARADAEQANLNMRLDQLLDLTRSQLKEIDLLAEANRIQAENITVLQARVDQLSRTIVNLGGQIPGSTSRSQSVEPRAEPECDGPPGKCKPKKK